MMQPQELEQRYEPLRLVRRQLQHSNGSETSIFLGINISIVVVLLICILGYCYFFRNRFDAIIRHQLELNDQALEQNIRDRQLERERVLAAAQQRMHRPTNNTDNDVTAAMNDNDDDIENEESTDSRRALLVDSFLRNNVTMVRTK
jgi:ABC-type lipoprotein release transport system permease subunit